MGFATVLLGILVLSACLDTLVPGPFLLGLRLGLAGVALLASSSLLHPGEGDHLSKTLRPFLGMLGLITVFLLIQILPFGFLANPVWTSASDALPGGLWGHVTVDVGATVLALLGVLLFACVVLLAATLTVDRTQAEGMLIALLCAGVALPALGQVSALVDASSILARRGAALDGLVLSALVILAYADLSFERHETRHLGQPNAWARIMAVEFACALALICCIGVASFFGGQPIFLATAIGVLTFGSLVAARRLGWGAWLTVGVLLVSAAAFLSVQVPDLHAPGSLFTGVLPADGIEARMMRDVPWLGTGAGTVPAFSELYRTAGDPIVQALSSAAAQMRIEIGLPALVALIVLVVGLDIFLMRAALKRGRDSIYAILGASVLPTLLALAFVNRGVLDWGVIVIGASILGLALSQSLSRTVIPHRA